MISYQAFTEEIDDLEIAVSELKNQLGDKTLLKNTCGIVFADSDADCEKLSKLLDANFDFPFLGVTDIASLTSDGYHDSIISMLILTADDCDFSLVYTEELRTIDDNKLKEAYEKASKQLNKKEKVIISFLPWSFTVTYDDVVDILDVASGGVPVFGGICADSWKFTNALVFSNSVCKDACGALLLVSGNINPILMRAHSVVVAKNTEREVVSATGNILSEIGESDLSQYLKDNFIINDRNPSLGSFLATPFIVSRKTADGDKIELLRSLNLVDIKEGRGVFVGGIRNGDNINLSFINKAQMEKSITRTFNDLMAIIDERKGYSTILCSSCGARYTMIVGDKQTEARGYVGRLPEGINLHGGYMFGEFCPVRGEKTGKLYNAFNNETFAILAF